MVFVSDCVAGVQRTPCCGAPEQFGKLSIMTGNSHLIYGEIFIEGKIEGRI
jgi:hypothetical protein